MPAGVWSRRGKWRAFADAVALALGVNVWVSVVLLPGLFVGAWRDGANLAAAIMPLPLLLLGIWRRSEWVLLLAFPTMLLLPIGLEPAMASPHVYGPVRFVVVAAGVVAYLLGASVFTSFSSFDATTANTENTPVSTRSLSSSGKPVSERWKRRFRIYRLLALTALVFPAVLLYVVNFSSTNAAFVRQMFPGRVVAMTTVMNLLVIGFWLVLYVHVILGTLKPHRTGDRAMVTRLGQMRADAARGRPRLSFYAWVVVALTFMLVLLLSRYS